MRCYQYKQRQMSGKDDELIILYEGNFTDGQQQTSRIFIAQGRPNLAYPAIAHPASYFSPAVYHRSGFGDMQIIVRSISAYVLARIPIDLDLGVGPLYAWLEKLCTPFRILNLSPELRVNIYEQVIACDQIRNIGYPSHRQSRPCLSA